MTLRIFNVLAQLMAIPVLQTGEFANGQPLSALALRCGNYIAFWNGNFLNTTQPVPPGVYLYRIEVDGRATARKMVVVTMGVCHRSSCRRTASPSARCPMNDARYFFPTPASTSFHSDSARAGCADSARAAASSCSGVSL